MHLNRKSLTLNSTCYTVFGSRTSGIPHADESDFSDDSLSVMWSYQLYSYIYYFLSILAGGNTDVLQPINMGNQL